MFFKWSILRERENWTQCCSRLGCVGNPTKFLLQTQNEMQIFFLLYTSGRQAQDEHTHHHHHAFLAENFFLYVNLSAGIAKQVGEIDEVDMPDERLK